MKLAFSLGVFVTGGKAAACSQFFPNWASALPSFSFPFPLFFFSYFAFRDGGKMLQHSLFSVHSALPWCLPLCPKFPAAQNTVPDEGFHLGVFE